ncbi:MAG: polar amino acid transport system substrate-binding protein [Solirubrobacteraceae bacterium]|jgi:polar amino acid transport system substrate-binding protein|nr:polar amino acid transport system substrate-binding protein [Solirubrobacteraceae bacterium]
MRPLAFLLALVAALAVAACGDDEGSTGSSTTETAASSDPCAKDQLETVTAGTLTVGTDKPAYPPYFADDDPTNGKGFESAVAYAIAGRLGFAKDAVKWKVVPFNSSYAPGPKDFDFDVNQISITPKRAERVDFSSPYFEAPQAVVLPPKSDLKVSTLADLARAKLGVQVGTTSLDAVQEVVKPSEDPQVFNDSNDVVQALKQGRVDGVVVDLPTAFYVTAAQVEGATIAGQFAAPGGDRWGALLQKDSPLTPCVSKAIDDLKASGELDKIQSRELGKAAGAPELT